MASLKRSVAARRGETRAKEAPTMKARVKFEDTTAQFLRKARADYEAFENHTYTMNSWQKRFRSTRAAGYRGHTDSGAAYDPLTIGSRRG